MPYTVLDKDPEDNTEGKQTPKHVTINQDFHFDAAHHLPGYDGPCGNVHGHRWDLTVSYTGLIDPKTGMAEDFKTFKKFVQYQVIDELDHKDLNHIIDNPTAENLCVWIWDRLSAYSETPMHPLKLESITLWESPDSYIEYRGGVS